MAGVVTLCCAGMMANALSAACLQRHWSVLPRVGRRLLRHQCVLDTALCVAIVIRQVEPPMWTWGVSSVDAIWCRVWHSGFLFSSSMVVSLWIMALTVVDQMLLIAKPPSGVSRESRSYLPLTIYAVGYVCCTPIMAAVSMRDGKCLRNATLPGDLDVDSFNKLSDIALLSAQLVPILYLLVYVCRMLSPPEEPQTAPSVDDKNGGSGQLANWVGRKTVIVFVLIMIAISLVHVTNLTRLVQRISLGKLVLVVIWVKSLVVTPMVSMNMLHHLADKEIEDNREKSMLA